MEVLGFIEKVPCFSNSSAASENGKRFSFNNKSNKTFCRVKIDGCLIDNNNNIKKSDYFFKVCESGDYFIVELKGIDIKTAVDQVVSTFQMLNAKLKKPASNFKGIIVSSSVPKEAELKFRGIKERVFRDKGLNIIKAHNQYKLNI